MTLKKISTLCLVASTVFAASSAMAWESADGAHSLTASVALSSDYVWRGVSQTARDPAISGSFDYAHSSGFYAGAWASNVDFGTVDPGANIEIDLYTGFGGELDNGLGWDAGYLRYTYPGSTGNLDWNEYHVAASYGIVNASVNYGTDVYGSTSNGMYYTLGLDYSLPQDFSVSANVGYYDYQNGDVATGNTNVPNGASDWNIGVSKDLADFGFDLRYYGSSNSLETQWATNNPSDSVVISISKSM